MKPTKENASLWQRFTARAAEVEVPAAGSDTDNSTPIETDRDESTEINFEAEMASAETITPPPLPSTPVAPLEVPQTLLSDARFLSDLCTRLWRFENRLNDVIRKRGDDGEIERLSRRFEEIMETLRRNDCEILDPIGQKYDAGLSLRVLQYEPREDLRQETIIETVKPTLRVKGVLVPGEVVVGVPAPIAPAEEKFEVEEVSEAPQTPKQDDTGKEELP